MNIYIKFKNFPKTTLKNKTIKKLGEAWKSGQNIHINLNINSPIESKTITLVEEILHIILLVINKINKKKIAISKEHEIIHKIIKILQENNILPLEN